jgi:predicted DNA-binding protein (MmcQ/YjbR family)
MLSDIPGEQMQLVQIRDYLSACIESQETTPFGPENLVFKVRGKLFAILAWQEEPLRVNLKCDPDEALHLRSNWSAILPGYHMNKEHWNTVILDGTLSTELVENLIDDSWLLVVGGHKKADREELLGKWKRRSGDM